MQVIVGNSTNMYHLNLKCILLKFFHVIETAPSFGMVIQFLSHGAQSINCIISPPRMNTALTLRVRKTVSATNKKSWSYKRIITTVREVMTTKG